MGVSQMAALKRGIAGTDFVAKFGARELTQVGCTEVIGIRALAGANGMSKFVKANAGSWQ